MKPPPPLGRRARAGLELLAAAALALAGALTWPALPNLGEVIIGGGELGGWMWRYGWHFGEVEAIGQSELGPLESLFTFLSLGRYPETGNILDILLLSFPLQLFWDLPAHYNLKIFLILVLDGLCGYALARRFTTSRSAALAASLVAVINPVALQDLYGSGLRQVLLWWMLLFPALLDRAEKLRTPGAGLLAGACLGLVGAFYWFYGLFAGIFLILWAADFGWRRWRGAGVALELRRAARWLVPLGVAVVAVAGTFVLPYVVGEGEAAAGAQAGGSALPEVSFLLSFPEYDQIAEAPLRPSNYAENVLSSLNRTIVSAWALDYLWRPSYFRPLPAIVLWLGVLPALLIRERPGGRSRFWLAIFTLFFLTSLGPFLKIGTSLDHTSSEVLKFTFLGEDRVVRLLPFTWMFKGVPGFSRMFAPYRVASMVVVASGVLVACGIGRIPNAWLRRGVAAAAIAATFAQTLYRFELGPIQEGDIAPSMWRAPVPVSAMQVPEWYRGLDPDAGEGIIELPLEQQQDVLYFYQLTHGHKVYRSWATPPAIPPAFRDEDGGAAGEKMRYLAQEDMAGASAEAVLLQLGRDPAGVELAASLGVEPFAQLALAGNYRWLIIHERGYFLEDPRRGYQMYRAAVRGFTEWLGYDPAAEPVEIKWVDFPGNPYHGVFADVDSQELVGPAFVAWGATEVNLPPREMPQQYNMAVFDLKPFLDAYDGPLPTPTDGPGPTHREVAPGG